MVIFQEIAKNNLIELKKFLQYGNINITDEEGKSLLHHAVASAAHDCINVLLDNYIDVNLADNNGQTAIFEAAIRARVGMLKILIRHNALVDIKDIYGNIPLFYAIRTNNTAVIDLLYSLSDINTRNNKLESALFIAIKYNCDNIQRFINDENIFYVTYKNESILHYACKSNNLEFIKKYISRETINFKNSNNETVFFYAVKYSNREVVRYLFEFLPCIDIVNTFQENLLDVVKQNFYDITDIIDEYLNSLDYLYYKKNNNIIYSYLCNNEINDKLTKSIINKKDQFNLSLLDYVKFNKDNKNLKKLIKL